MDEEPGRAEEPQPLRPFEDEVSRIQQVIDAYDHEGPSHIAVIGDPYAGQEVIMQEIKRRNAGIVTHVPLFNVVKEQNFLSAVYGEKDIILMERCHFLALRKIGGFEMLDAFLDLLARSEKLFITGWNTYSWSYLHAVRQIETFFPRTVQIPRLDNATLRTLILSRYEDTIRFIDDTGRKEEPFYEIKPYQFKIPVIERPVAIPWPRINTEALASGTEKQGTTDVEDAVFDRINRIAEGNYGVALRIWERILEYPEVKLSDIPEIPCAIDLGIDESFLLNIILSMESINSIDLAEIAGPEIGLEQTLYRLTNQGLIEKEKGYYQVKPEALNCVIGYLRRARMVW